MADAEVDRFGPAAAVLLGTVGLTYSASVAGFIVVRFVLGLGESGNFPAAIKTVAEWFPQRERAFATGLFNAGTNIGAVITPMTVPFITARFGWYWAFVADRRARIRRGWSRGWWCTRSPIVIRGSARRSARSSPAIRRCRRRTCRGRACFGYRQTWSFAAAKFLTDPIWWMYLFWLPDFFSRTYGLSLLQLGPPIIVIYVVADIGSVGGGWLSSSLIRRGWSVNARAQDRDARSARSRWCRSSPRRSVQSMWGAVALISLATAAHQGWSANCFTLASDMFPRQAVGSVVGLGGFAGAVGGMLIAKLTGYVLQMTGSYTTVLMIAGGAYLVGARGRPDPDAEAGAGSPAN